MEATIMIYYNDCRLDSIDKYTGVPIVCKMIGMKPAELRPAFSFNQLFDESSGCRYTNFVSKPQKLRRSLTMPVDPIAPHCNSVNVSIVVKDGKQAIEFYKQAFGASARFLSVVQQINDTLLNLL